MLTSAAVATLLVLSGTATADRRGGDLAISVARAPIVPDGVTAGAPPDLVVTFRDPDPTVPGIGLAAGGTITIELDDAFDLTGDQLTPPKPPGPPPTPAILLQGWPQSPRPDFPYTTTVIGNTVTLTMTAAWPVGAFGPGPKAVHLALFASANPPRPGRYTVDVTVVPAPGDPPLEGHGHVAIVPVDPPAVSVVSLFSGTPPPPFPNPLHQAVSLGDEGLRVGMYLWHRAGRPAVGIELVRTDADHYRLVRGRRTVGHVHITSPPGARDHVLTSEGPSVLGTTFVAGVPTGLLLTTFVPDPHVAGSYVVAFSMTGGERAVMHYDVG